MQDYTIPTYIAICNDVSEYQNNILNWHFHDIFSQSSKNECFEAKTQPIQMQKTRVLTCFGWVPSRLASISGLDYY